MAEQDDSIFGNLFAESEQEIQPETVGALDYLTDIPVGILKGASQAVQGLVSLGAMPIDYLANTNLISAIDNIFDKITPETDTIVGDVTSVITQFGVPLGAAAKIANGVLKLNKASQIVKLNNFRRADNTYDYAGASGELAKRAGYWGALGGVTDFAVSTPGDLTTLSSTLGFGEGYKGDELKGSAKAAEYFKEKIKFGAEGVVLGGGLTAALPVAGTVGLKYGLIPAGKTVAYAGGKALRAIDYTVFNPLQKIIGSETVGAGAKTTMEFLGNQSTKIRQKLNIPDPKNWKFYSTDMNAPFKERLLKRLDNYKNAFKSDGPLSISQADELRKVEGFVQRDEKGLVKIMNQIDNQFKEIAKGADVLEVPKYLQTKSLKYPKPITAIDDEMYLRNNDILYDYVQTRRVKTTVDGKELFKDSEEALSYLNKLPKETQKNAKELKKQINDLGLNYGKLLSQNPDEALADLGATIVGNGGAYLKQVFSVMKNKAYEFDAQKVAGAREFFKKTTVPKIDSSQPEVINNLMKEKNIGRAEAIDLLADNSMAQLKKSLIESNRSPETLFRLVANTFKLDKKGQLLDITKKVLKDGKEVEVFTSTGKLIKAGGDMPTIMKKVMDDESLEKVTSAFLEPLKDYRAAITDTFIQTAKQVYKKEFFDRFAESGLKSGVLYRSIDDAIAKGVPNANDLRPVVADLNPGSKNFDLFESDLFKGGLSRSGDAPAGLYTTPEIANAVKGTEEYLSRMYDIPLYSALMSVKAAGQIGKTVFSPMTQVRNVSTASFFALASGLIGGRVSLTDSFKLMADDIFPTKFISAADVAKKMEDRIARGVVDQNIEVNEIKTILEKAKDGKFTMSALVNSPIVKKAFDLYQGGDNVWKIYADDFYQDALGTAFQYSSKGLKGDAAIRDNIIDWYRTVGKQADVADELVGSNAKIAQIDEALKTATPATRQSLLNQKENLVQQFKDVKDISAYLVTNTIPTYSKVPTIIKNIRNLPLGNFVAFPAEILRTSAHLIEIGARELTSSNPFIRQMGARRLVGASAVFGGTGKIIESAAEKITGVTSEKMEAFQRSVAPDYQKNSNLIPLTESDEKGNFKYFNFSYTNPYDSMLRPINAVLNAYGNGTLTNQSASQIVYNALIYDNLNDTPGAFAEFFDPFISESIGAGAIADLTIRGGKTKEGKTIYYEQDNAMEKIDASLGHLMSQLEPGGSRSARRVWKGVTQDFTDYGTTYDGATEMVALMSGLRVENAKPMDSLPFIVTSYSKDLESIQKKFSSNIYSPNLDLNGRIGYMTEYLTDNYDAQSRLFQVVKDMELMGADIGEIEDTVSIRFKNKKRVNAIMNGEYIAPNISEARIESIIERLYDENPVNAARVEDEFLTATDIFEDMRMDLEAIELGEGPESFRETIDFTLNPPSVQNQGTPGLTGIESVAEVELPLPVGIGTPVNASLFANNNNLGNQFNLLPNNVKFDKLFPQG
tara:strand:- start:933 stop:5342 length:4410 start_codon:yes stop_codon:yes gene_type:complete